MSVNVIIDRVGGDDRCSVSEIEVTASAGSLGSTTKSVKVPGPTPGTSVSVQLGGYGYNAIYAIGKCGDGKLTERSNGVSVFSSMPVESTASPLPSPSPSTPPKVFSILGVNRGGKLWYNSNINSATAGSSWTEIGTGYQTVGCTLSGTNAAAISTTADVIKSTTNASSPSSWISTSATGTSVSIATSARAIYLATVTPKMAFYTTNLATANPQTSTVVSPSTGILQVALSGTAAMGRSSTDLFYIALISVGTPSWGTALALPSGVTAPSTFSFNYENAVVVQGSDIYYTTKISASPVVWQQVTPMPTSSDFTGDIIEVSISGYQIIFTVDNGAYDQTQNIFLAEDFTSPVWSHPDGNLDCIAMTV